MADLTFREFTNRLRALLNIDYIDLQDIIGEDEWRVFRTNPWGWMIHADSERAEKVFNLMEVRVNRRRPMEESLKEFGLGKDDFRPGNGGAS